MPPGTDASGGPPLSAAQVLAELDFLAAVEHSLCVEYLLIHSALGHDLFAADDGEPAQHVASAAGGAFQSAVLHEMPHLSSVNQALAKAERPPQVGRATSIRRASGAEIAFVPLTMHELERIADREHEITEAVDERYARLRSAVTSPDSPFAGELQEELAGLLDPGPDHSDVPTLLRTELYGIPPSVYLRATPQDPEGELERSLLGLSDRFYGVLVDVLPDAFRGFSPTAVSTMRGVHEINRLLVERGVLPAFTPVKTVPDPLAP